MIKMSWCSKKKSKIKLECVFIAFLNIDYKHTIKYVSCVLSSIIYEVNIFDTLNIKNIDLKWKLLSIEKYLPVTWQIANV